jgi:hypothetical protein
VAQAVAAAAESVTTVFGSSGVVISEPATGRLSMFRRPLRPFRYRRAASRCAALMPSPLTKMTLRCSALRLLEASAAPATGAAATATPRAVTPARPASSRPRDRFFMGTPSCVLASEPPRTRGGLEESRSPW